VTQAQLEALQAAAKTSGFESVSAYLAWVADHPPDARRLPALVQTSKRQP